MTILNNVIALNHVSALSTWLSLVKAIQRAQYAWMVHCESYDYKYYIQQIIYAFPSN